MRLRLWRPSLHGGVPRHRLIAGALGLALVVGVLTASHLFSHPAAAAPGQQHTTSSALQPHSSGVPLRLDALTINETTISHRWSDNQGTTWSQPADLPVLPVTNSDGSGRSVSMPVAVSDGVGRLNVFAVVNNVLWANTSTNGSSWAGWRNLPGTESLDGAGVDMSHFVSGGPLYIFTSSPAVTSWAPGRMDLVIYAQTTKGHMALLHTWADNSIWSGTWEVVAKGFRQGNPAAVSWWQGRIDVLTFEADNTIGHFWFATGSGWSFEDLGAPATGPLTSDPSVTSHGVGFLDVFARGSDGGIWHIGFYSTSWGGWGIIDCCLDDVGDTVAVASATPDTLNLFAILTDHALYNRVYHISTNVWGPWQLVALSVDSTSITVTTSLQA